MIGTSIALEELERDALTELVNIGVSRAAVSLRTMVGEQVFLSVPSLQVVDRVMAAALIRERECDSLIAVRQDFEGAFSGRALLIFPEANSLELVRAVTSGELSGKEAQEIEEEALLETGNIVLNGCLGTIANMLRKPLTISLPQLLRGDSQQLFNVSTSLTDHGVVLFLYINFAISDRDIRGYIAMIMDLPSLQTLKVLIAEFIEHIIGPEGVAHEG
ncbi:chemotaxis protein CheX [Geminicoccus flavidas]|uniref:chemotaxis protein CheX n=1 Tax=Geminicoccus flavidas TaxID=2506407 RepID=UPI00135985C8|nr:chemotaxis protein CheX [Geminicoccus flavidas]